MNFYVIVDQSFNRYCICKKTIVMEESSGNLDIQAQISEMQMREQSLLQERQHLEEDFGQQRAKLKELFVQKEEELKKKSEQNLELFAELEQKSIMMQRLQTELDEARSQVTIAQCTAENEVAVERRKCQEEIATIQQLTKEELSLAVNEIHQMQQRLNYVEAERYRYRMFYEQHVEQANLNKQDIDKKEDSLLNPGVLSVMTKSIAKRVPSLSPVHSVGDKLADTSPSIAKSQESLEESMIKAQESANVMKSLVLPLEDEIRVLKTKLREQDAELTAREAQERVHLKTSEIIEPLLKGEPVGSIVQELDVKMKEVEESMQCPEASRGSLELYAAILNTQKTSLKEAIEHQRDELKELKKSLESERKNHRALRSVWEKANDKFLENQRIHLADMRKVRSILTVEQARKLQELQEMNDKEEHLSAMVPGQTGRSPDLLNSLQLDTESTAVPSNSKKLNFALDNAGLQLRSENDSITSTNNINTSDTEGSAHRVISESQWEKLQEEIRRYQSNVSYPCTLCTGFEEQCKKAAESLRDCEKQRHKFEGAVSRLKNELTREASYRKQAEAKWKLSADQYEREVKSLEQKVNGINALHENAVQTNKRAFQVIQRQLESLTSQRESISKELQRLQADNDKLIGKHSQHSQQIQNEIINLPDSMEEMQLLLLKYREEVICAKVAKEHTEETLKSEILFLKDQVSGEQHEKSSLESRLTSEIDQLREKAAISESLTDQLESETKTRLEASDKLKQSEQKRQDTMVRNQQLISGLKSQIEEQAKTKAQLEQTIQELKIRMSSLQQDLKTSECVQRDFVRLSQSLQVQLEAIRQSEKEVRWQHEDDVEDCNHCKQKFTVVGRRKHHCRHCGRVFCADCVSKVVVSGPNRRPSKVCDVCHTLLVNDATPFFSAEPPQSPD